MIRLFPNIQFVLTTKKDQYEVKAILDNLLRSNKYHGRWINNNLHLSKVTSSDHIITPNLKVSILKDNDDCKVIIESSMRERFEFSLKLIAGFMLVIEFLMIHCMVLTKEFSFGSIAPVVLVLGIYFVMRISNKWDAENFMYYLRRLLK